MDMRLLKKIFIVMLALVLSVGSFVSCKDKEAIARLEAIQTRSLVHPANSAVPTAADFVVDLPEGISVRFAEQYQFDHIGAYQLKLELSDADGNKVEKTVELKLVLDTAAPVISGVRDIRVEVGSGVSYKTGIVVTDDCDPNVSLTVDNSQVDLLRVGEYPVRYIATDWVGHTAIANATVYVYQPQVSVENLNQAIKSVADRIITSGMSKEEQCRAVYRYVYDHVGYVSKSEKSDWIYAAHLALDRGEGDCYSYYALSKAFFEYLGIENMCIQRSPESNSYLGETHFWNYVNIGTAQNPQWYHFDTTHLIDHQYTGTLVLITEEQLQHYNTVIRPETENGHFYNYDHTGYPASATVKITTLAYER